MSFTTTLFRALEVSQKVMVLSDEVLETHPVGSQMRIETETGLVLFFDDQSIEIDDGSGMAMDSNGGVCRFEFYTLCPLTEIDVAGGQA